MSGAKEMLSRYAFPGIMLLVGLILIGVAASDGQNGYVLLGLSGIVVMSALLLLHNMGKIKLGLFFVLMIILIVGASGFAYLDYSSVQNRLDFDAERARREAVVIDRLIDIRKAEASYKGLYGEYAGSFDRLLSHIKNDSMPLVKAIGSVPDTLTETEAVEMGIVIRDTMLISVRDTLFAPDYPLDSLPIVPFSGGKTFELQAGEIEKNKLTVKVFQAFASFGKIYEGMDLSEEYIDLSEGLSVGSMTEPNTRGNWE